MTDRDLSSYPLNEAMEFDHVVEVHPDGRVTDGPTNLYAPDLLDDRLSGDGWTLLDGYSGQDRYTGPVMHNSEFIGGQMERDILARPGYYVAIVASWSPDESEGPDAETDVEGWAVAYQPKVWRTDDGVEITPGLRVFTNDWAWGTVDAEQFERGGLTDPGGKYFNGWFHVTLEESGRKATYNGERMTTRKPQG